MASKLILVRILCTKLHKQKLNFTYILNFILDYGTAWDLCLILKDLGLLTKPCDENILRFTPPLNISEAQLNEGIKCIIKAVDILKEKTK